MKQPLTPKRGRKNKSRKRPRQRRASAPENKTETRQRSPVVENVEKTTGIDPLNLHIELDSEADSDYSESMAGPTTKAGVLFGSVNDLTVAELDEHLRSLSDNVRNIAAEWDLVLLRRQVRAKAEGDVTPAPASPFESFATTADNPTAVKDDFSVANLADSYLTDERSPYRTIRHATRQNYGSHIKRIVNDIGGWRLADIKSPNIDEFYRLWTSDGTKVGMGHALMTMFRAMINFGASTLEHEECVRLSVILRNKRFETTKPRTAILTEEHANLIRKMAHEMGLPSIALAQAFQYVCRLGQKDVIGEWVPLSERVPSDIINDDLKWIRGIRWEFIDENYVLRHITSRGTERIEVDLKRFPMAMEELKLSEIEKHSNGPMVVSETTGRAYTAVQFRRLWRKVADAAGVPDDVRNMDNRADDDDEEGETSSGRTAV